MSNSKVIKRATAHSIQEFSCFALTWSGLSRSFLVANCKLMFAKPVIKLALLSHFVTHLLWLLLQCFSTELYHIILHLSH